VDLKKRLAQFDRLLRTGGGNLQPQPPASGTAGRQDSPQAGESSVLLRDQLQLVCQQRPEGIVWRRDDLAAEQTAPPEPWPALTALLPRADLLAARASDLLFLDTETTGLVGGTGSLAFLIGLGWWTDAGFQLRQFFLSGPHLEVPMLAALGELLPAFRIVVTFNGRAFDLPLLRTRFLLARLANPLGELVSWDLLPAVRRLWGRRLPNCRQQTLESSVCGRRRGAGDIEGSQIPQTYFSFLRHGQWRQLPLVLEHNRRDLIGMAEIFHALLGRAAAIELGPESRAVAAGCPWQDAWANARVCETRRQPVQAARWAQLALLLAVDAARGTERCERPAALFVDATRLLKRVGAWSEVERTLQLALQILGSQAWLHRQAAILYEHRLRRLEAAYQHARILGEPVRLARLAAKLAREGR
jgi:uncharacterized protein YprB with RNaseH-like and TPR domain